MLYFILVWTALLISCLIIGCGVLHMLQARAVALRSHRIILATWLGLSVLCILLLAVALFTALSPLTGVMTISLTAMSALSMSAVRVELAGWYALVSSKVLLVYAVSALIISIFVSPQVTWLDTGLYHYGLIHWFSEYGVTPGLALLSSQFGFISAWFAILAPFNHTASAGRASALMNGFVLLLLLLQMVISTAHVFAVAGTTKNAVNQTHTSVIASSLLRLQNTFLLIFSTAVFVLVTQTPLLKTIAISASPDIAVVLFTVIMAWAMLVTSVNDTASTEKLAEKQTGKSTLLGAETIPLLLAIAAVSIKLTALPLLAIAVGFYLFKSLTPQQLFKRVLIGGACTFVLLLPITTAQSLSSGCPLYPSTALCLDLPWTIPADEVKSVAAGTHGWGQWFGQPPTSENRQLWLIQKWIKSNRSSKLIALLIVLSTVSGVYLLSQKVLTRQHNIPRYGTFWLVALGWLGTTFMMLKAPLFRFGMGYALLLPVFTISLLITPTIGSAHLQKPTYVPQPFKRVNLALIIAGSLLAVLLSRDDYATLGDRLITPPSLPEVAIRLQTRNGISYVMTQDKRSQCWSAQLPCISESSFESIEAVELRDADAGIRGGFRNAEEL